MHRILLAVALLALTISVGAQTPGRIDLLRQAMLRDGNVQQHGPVVEAESCTVELTAASQGNWLAFFRYMATVDGEGYISRLELPRAADERFRSFVRLDQFESCVRRWQFSGAGQYVVTLTAGTGGVAIRRWSVTVSQVTLPATGSFRLVFPRGPN